MKAIIQAQFLFIMLCAAGCSSASKPVAEQEPSEASQSTLREARAGFVTKIIRAGDDVGPPERPPGQEFELIHYQSSVGPLAAYVTPDPADGQKHPAIIWVTGGDSNSIGDVWTDYDRRNDQSASAFRKAGVVMMFPSQRGGNDNPGQREGFYGEVDDVLAAAEHLANLPYVDPGQLYLGGHSTGGTLVLLVAAYSDRFRAVFSLGPVAAAEQYGGEFVYCDLGNTQEMVLRAPNFWLQGINSPVYVFEGATNGNWDAIEMMVESNVNPNVQFFKLAGHDHFSVIAPLAERLSAQIIAGKLEITADSLQSLR